MSISSYGHKELKIAIIGLGYVGLPLAVEFGKKISTIGFDINSQRISELNDGVDLTLEVEPETLKSATHLTCTSSPEDIQSANVYIVTVPTPIDEHKRPDLSPLISASRLVGGVLANNDVVIYESTVYPGATEEVCIPILEAISGLTYNRDFFAGYSPERINPGDKSHSVTSIRKVTSGSTPEVAGFVDNLYNAIITAGTYCAGTIRTAEAAKVIENTQRDVNIALINELALIFHKLDIDTSEVLEAAATKWNFLPFKPGLVGGHCIGVDPYYLTHKAQEIGYYPRIILAGREINDAMGAYVAEQVVKLMTRKKIHVVDSSILVLGFTFKENCPDFRNTRVIDIIHELEQFNANVEVYDPWFNAANAVSEYGITVSETLEKNTYDAIIVGVGHDQFAQMDTDYLRTLGKKNSVLYDVKGLYPKDQVDGRI